MTAPPPGATTSPPSSAPPEKAKPTVETVGTELARAYAEAPRGPEASLPLFAGAERDAELLLGKSPGDGLGPNTRVVLSNDASSLLVIGPRGALLAAAPSGEVRAFAPGVSPTFACNSVVAIAVRGGGASKVELRATASGDRLFSFDERAGGPDVVCDDAYAYYVPAHDPSEPDRVHRFDIAGRRALGPLTLSESDVALPAKPALRPAEGASPIESLLLGEDGKTLLVLHETGDTEVWNLAAGRRMPALATNGATWARPTFSADGRWLAIAVRLARPIHPPYDGAVVILDRSPQGAVRVLDDCSYPAHLAFSIDGELLSIGDLRAACVHALPSFKLLGKTPPLRKAGLADDLQNVVFQSFVGDAKHRGLVIATADDSAGLFLVGHNILPAPGAPSLSPLQGHYVSGERLFVTTERTSGARVLVTLDAALHPTERPLSSEEAGDSQRIPEIAFAFAREVAQSRARDAVSARACHVGDYVFPRAACAPRQP